MSNSSSEQLCYTWKDSKDFNTLAAAKIARLIECPPKNRHLRLPCHDDPPAITSCLELPSSSAFPVKLHYVISELEKEGCESIVGWQSHGRSFVVRDLHRFEHEILPKWFTTANVSSFQRQLNLYSFERIWRGKDKGGYFHKQFVRGDIALASQIKRRKIKGTGCRKPRDPDQEPDFYQMEPAPATRRAVACVKDERKLSCSPTESHCFPLCCDYQGRTHNAKDVRPQLKEVPQTRPRSIITELTRTLESEYARQVTVETFLDNALTAAKNRQTAELVLLQESVQTISTLGAAYLLQSMRSPSPSTQALRVAATVSDFPLLPTGSQYGHFPQVPYKLLPKAGSRADS